MTNYNMSNLRAIQHFKLSRSKAKVPTTDKKKNSLVPHKCLLGYSASNASNAIIGMESTED